MPARIYNPRNDEQGFTLIELLVVILIIGALAAIALPSFLDQQTKGKDSCAKAAARMMQTAMETFLAESNTYTGGTPAALSQIENQIPASGGACGSATAILTGSQSPGAACSGNAPGVANYCVFVESQSGNSFQIFRSTTGAIVRNCTPAGAGGCNGAGAW